MRKKSCVGVLVLVMAVMAPVAIAGELPPGAEPPQARIRPPGGVQAEARIKPPSGIQSAGDSQSLIELAWIWLQARIRPPIG